MKKVLVPILILVVCALVLAGCSSQSTTTTAPSAKPAPTTQAPAATAAAPKPAATTAAPAAPAAPAATTAAAPAPSQKSGGILRVLDMRLPTGSLGNPPKINVQDGYFLQAAIETLVRLDPKGAPQPQLATSWEVAPDKKSMTLKLRQGVKFHDGTDFNATAAKYNLDAARDAKLAGTTSWSSVDIVDGYTVRINISKWENLIYGNLAGLSGMMVSPSAIQKNGIEWANTNIAATGPFMLSNFQRDTVLEFKKNPNYWQKGKPYLDGIKYICMPDSMAQIAAFKAGEAELLQPWSGMVLSQVKGLPKTTFQYRHSGVFVLYPDPANADSPFSKKEVRQALEYAIDKDALMKVAGFGIFEAAYQVPCPAAVGFVKDVAPRKYDPDKAKLLLVQAGLGTGFETTLTITIPAPDIKDAQVAISGMLAKVGIKCKLDMADPAKYSDFMMKGWKNTLIYSPANSEGNFTNTFQNYYTIPNFYVSLKVPDSIMGLYNTALTSAEVEPAKVEALGKAVFDDASLVPVSYMGTGQVYADYLKDAGFLTFFAQMNFAPENAWFNK